MLGGATWRSLGSQEKGGRAGLRCPDGQGMPAAGASLGRPQPQRPLDGPLGEASGEPPWGAVVGLVGGDATHEQPWELQRGSGVPEGAPQDTWPRVGTDGVARGSSTWPGRRGALWGRHARLRPELHGYPPTGQGPQCFLGVPAGPLRAGRPQAPGAGSCERNQLRTWAPPDFPGTRHTHSQAPRPSAVAPTLGLPHGSLGYAATRKRSSRLARPASGSEGKP